MSRWTIGEGDAEMIIEAAGGQISVAIPSGQPIIAAPGVAKDMRAKLGAAIGIAQGTQTDPTA